MRFLTRPQASFPQQLPGPAQPAAEGEDPQQEVSPGPGTLLERTPESELVADRSFFMLALPQAVHFGLSSDERMRTSEDFPQSRHR